MLDSVDSEPRPKPGRQLKIDARLATIRVRLKELRERDWVADRNRTANPSERVAVAKLHAAEAHEAAVRVLASGVEAFRHAAEAHEKAASTHERVAATGTGDVLQHERQASLHRLAAAADRQRAERAQSLLPEPEQAGPAAAHGEATT
jgi:hypothetical protein